MYLGTKLMKNIHKTDVCDAKVLEKNGGCFSTAPISKPLKSNPMKKLMHKSMSEILFGKINC